MLVSIVINNYNYGRYLAVAIDSALSQTWSALEVLVVDDGSTDDSWSIVQRYGTRVRALRQPNGGQGAAYNTGFSASQGEWVLFLDADDCLDADAIERSMALALPDVAKVQGRLRTIGPDGTRLRGSVPYLIHDGDVRPIATRFRQYAGPPASGNLFRRSAIEPYFPLDAPAWRRSADTVPILLSVFHGRVATVRDAIGSYRLHTGVNRASGLLGNMDRSFADALAQATQRRLWAERWGSACTGIQWSGPMLTPPFEWRTRALSWRLQPGSHPYPHDSRAGLWHGLTASLASWPGYGALDRLAQRLWMAFMLCAPRAGVAALAASNVSGGLRSGMRWLRTGKVT